MTMPVIITLHRTALPDALDAHLNAIGCTCAEVEVSTRRGDLVDLNATIAHDDDCPVLARVGEGRR